MCDSINPIDLTMSFDEVKEAVALRNATHKKSHNPETCKIKGTVNCQKICGNDMTQAIPAHLLALNKANTKHNNI